MYQGQYFKLNAVPAQNKIIELIFDSDNDPVNRLSKDALTDLEKCISVLEKEENVEGLIIRSNKKLFSAGANVKEFQEMFSLGEKRIKEYLSWSHSIYNRIEDLPYPKVALVHGTVAGGAVELTLLADYRLAASDTVISMPEVKLGIFPAWGGITRLPRIIGLDTAISWLTTGKNFRAPEALKAHIIDGILNNNEAAKDEAIALLSSAINNKLDWKSRYNEKQSPLTLNKYELNLSLNVSRGMIAKVAGPNYPAPRHILNTLEEAAYLTRDEALKVEINNLVACVQDNNVSDALVNVFLSDLAVKSIAKSYIKAPCDIENIGVIGAGIMGGGIAYVSSSRNMGVVLKDINATGLKVGLSEANLLFAKQVERGKMSPLDMGNALNHIVPTLHNNALENTDLIIEAVVENPEVKKKVLSELESVAPKALLASNTSTLMISGLASSLKKPENFCGIHFFNPVHKMPLVEVIRGKETSDETISKAVSYVLKLKKTPIVINDCAGFLVNRCLTPYFLAFNQLLVDGAQISQIDKVMSKGFGWPMGPALLLDVIGIDTAAHCVDVMSKAFPSRHAKPKINLIEQLCSQGFLGQKSGEGFYLHQRDPKGRMKPAPRQATTDLLKAECAPQRDFTDEEIQLRMMLPMMFEVVRCLEEGIVGTPAEADIAFIYGTGFPPFRGGLLYYMDRYGLGNLVSKAQQFEHLGPLYQIPRELIDRAESNRPFYA